MFDADLRLSTAATTLDPKTRRRPAAEAEVTGTARHPRLFPTREIDETDRPEHANEALGGFARFSQVGAVARARPVRSWW